MSCAAFRASAFVLTVAVLFPKVGSAQVCPVRARRRRSVTRGRGRVADRQRADHGRTALVVSTRRAAFRLFDGQVMVAGRRLRAACRSTPTRRSSRTASIYVPVGGERDAHLRAPPRPRACRHDRAAARRRSRSRARRSPPRRAIALAGDSGTRRRDRRGRAGTVADRRILHAVAGRTTRPRQDRSSRVHAPCRAAARRDGVWLEFNGARWYSDGPADRFRRIASSRSASTAAFRCIATSTRRQRRDLGVGRCKDGPLAPYASEEGDVERRLRPAYNRPHHDADSGHQRRRVSVGGHSRARRARCASSATSRSSRRSTEASAIGHALTLRRPLRLEPIDDRVFAVDGTPTDCVNIAVTQVFKGLPDLVVSGINKGWNLGDDVTYSGTVAGALEGALLGIPSIAVSLRQTRGDYDFSHAARAAAAMAEAMLRQPLPARTFLNINVPKGRAEGLSRHRAGEAESRHVGRRAARSEGAAVLLDRGRAERVGAARSVGLSGGARRLRVGDAAASRPDGASRARGGRGAVVREGDDGRVALGPVDRVVRRSRCAAASLVGVVLLAVAALVRPCRRARRRRRASRSRRSEREAVLALIKAVDLAQADRRARPMPALALGPPRAEVGQPDRPTCRSGSRSTTAEAASRRRCTCARCRGTTACARPSEHSYAARLAAARQRRDAAQRRDGLRRRRRDADRRARRLLRRVSRPPRPRRLRRAAHAAEGATRSRRRRTRRRRSERRRRSAIRFCFRSRSTSSST